MVFLRENGRCRAISPGIPPRPLALPGASSQPFLWCTHAPPDIQHAPLSSRSGGSTAPGHGRTASCWGSMRWCWRVMLYVENELETRIADDLPGYHTNTDRREHVAAHQEWKDHQHSTSDGPQTRRVCGGAAHPLDNIQ